MLFRSARTAVVCVLVSGLSVAAYGQSAGSAVRIESVVPLPVQPHDSDDAVIWSDDFEDAGRWSQYPEKSDTLDDAVGFGGQGRSLRMDYPKGHRGKGGLKLVFGDSPVYPNKAVHRGRSFDDIYWRVYVKHQPGWTGGGPAKLSRATSFASSRWSQAMIAHVWSSGEALTLDPATGVQGGQVVTRRYNDFEKLDWLGNRPVSPFRIHSTAEAGWWVCVEARARLNTVGKKDGINQLWIDGRLQCERRNLDWRGDYAEHGINAVFLEAYWNRGSPVDQSRWLDNFVVSTRPIGPVVCGRNPVLIRTAIADGSPWQVEVAAAAEPAVTVWRSRVLSDVDRVTVDGDSGSFAGTLESEDKLAASAEYVARIRLVGQDTDWSNWHQTFRTNSE
jgi:hypothetical protein